MRGIVSGLLILGAGIVAVLAQMAGFVHGHAFRMVSALLVLVGGIILLALMPKSRVGARAQRRRDST